MTCFKNNNSTVVSCCISSYREKQILPKIILICIDNVIISIFKTTSISKRKMALNRLPVLIYEYSSGADPGFQVRGGAHLKELCRAEGGVKIFGVFRVKNHDFTTKKSYFYQFYPPLRFIKASIISDICYG